MFPIKTPSVRKLDKLISSLENLTVEQLKRMPLPFLATKLGELYVGHVTRTLKATYPKKLYRARMNTGSKLYDKKSEVWYPPAKYVDKLGRANNLNEEVFYCSEYYDTCICELRPSLGDTFTVAETELIPDHELNLAQIGLAEMSAAAAISVSNELINARSVQFRSAFSDSEWEKWTKVDAFIGRAMTKNIPAGENQLYKMCVAITQNAFKFDGLDGIMYPSFISKKMKTNICLSVAAADSKLRLNRLDMFEVTRLITPETFEVHHLKVANVIEQDGLLVWRDAGQNEKISLLKSNPENKVV